MQCDMGCDGMWLHIGDERNKKFVLKGHEVVREYLKNRLTYRRGESMRFKDALSVSGLSEVRYRQSGKKSKADSEAAGREREKVKEKTQHANEEDVKVNTATYARLVAIEVEAEAQLVKQRDEKKIVIVEKEKERRKKAIDAAMKAGHPRKECKHITQRSKEQMTRKLKKLTEWKQRESSKLRRKKWNEYERLTGDTSHTKKTADGKEERITSA